MADIQHLPSCIVRYIHALPYSTYHQPVYRSYWTWYILLLLVVASQLIGVAEKFWIKVC